MDIMIDFETLGLAPNAALLAIGAAEFDPLGQGPGRVFEVFITPHVGVIEHETVLWWMKQPNARQMAEQVEKDGVALWQAAMEFQEWYREMGEIRYVWAVGRTDFQQAELILDLRLWTKKQERDVRTACDVGGIDRSLWITAHWPLMDVMAQVEFVQAAHAKARGK